MWLLPLSGSGRFFSFCFIYEDSMRQILFCCWAPSFHVISHILSLDVDATTSSTVMFPLPVVCFSCRFFDWHTLLWLSIRLAWELYFGDYCVSNMDKMFWHKEITEMFWLYCQILQQFCSRENWDWVANPNPESGSLKMRPRQVVHSKDKASFTYDASAERSWI